MANLSGMFQQLNQAVLGNPLAGDAGGDLLTMGSQGLGRTIGAATGTDPMRWMTPEAKEQQAKESFARMDLSTAEGLKAASRVYAQLGDVEKAMAMEQASKAKMEENANTVLQRKHQASLLDTVYNDDKISQKDKQRYYDAVNAGIIKTEKDLIDMRDYKDIKALEGAYTEKVIMNGKEYPVRYNRYNQPIAVLGEGRGDMKITTLINPANNQEQSAIVNVNDPTNVQFLGGDAKPQPQFDIITGSDGRFHVWKTDPTGVMPPERQAIVDTMDDAETAAAKSRAQLDTVNIMGTIGQAINMIDEGSVGGWRQLAKYLPETEARRFEALVNTIKSNVGFDSLKAMKAEGSSLGQVAIIELMMLQSEIANLDTYQDGASLKAGMTKIKNHYNNVNRALTSQNPDTLLQPQLDVNGAPTGNKLYAVDDNTVVILRPDGSMETVIRGQQSE